MTVEERLIKAHAENDELLKELDVIQSEKLNKLLKQIIDKRKSEEVN